jgi:tRNA(fMet)-specific endonuclease VapC
VAALLGTLERRFTDQIIVLSAMSAAELVHGIWRATAPHIRTRREEFVEEVFARIPVRAFNPRTARIAGRIDAQSRMKGKVVPTVDLYIGALAMELQFSVVTANVRHFKLIPGLKVVRFS